MANHDESTLKRVFISTSWMMFAHGSRVIFNGLYIVLIARALGPREFGAFAAAVSLCGVLIPFVGWGGGSLLLVNVAQSHKNFSVYWSAAVVKVIVTSLFFSLVLVVAGKLFYTASLTSSMLLRIGISDLFLWGFIELSNQTFQAYERLNYSAVMAFITNLSRFIAVMIFLAYPKQHMLDNWLYYYTLSNLLGAVVGISLVKKIGTDFSWSNELVRKDLMLGFQFAVGTAAKSVYTDIDKVILAMFSPLSSVGIYAAAYRVINIAFLPIQALLSASYARFYRIGGAGIEASVAFALKIVRFSVIYALFSAVVIYTLAPFLPELLGAQYLGISEVLKWLCIVPLIQAVHTILAEILTSVGKQVFRTYSQISVAAINVTLNLLFIPSYGWRGAILATILSELILAILLSGFVIHLHKKSNSLLESI